MASDTKNVKLGVCKVFFDGIDLGYTQGGVEVTVSTETHRVEIDQFGKTAINELILGRTVNVKVPLAETTLENMVRIMPGATLVTAAGVKATGSYTIGTNPTNGLTAIINGVTFTFRTGSAPLSTDVLIGATSALTGDAFRTKLNASFDPRIGVCDYTGTGTLITITYLVEGTEGNSFTLAAGTAAGTVSGATLAGGSEPTAKRVDVTDGIGTDLLAIAKKLVLHPRTKVDTDRSEDFTLPLAATPGGLTFAYKLDAERIYNVEFTGYPDVNAGNKLFWIGDADVVES